MLNHEIIYSDLKNVKYNNLMNKTLNSFSKTKTYKNIPILNSFQCQSSAYEFKYNKTNYRNKIERINNKSLKNTIIKPNINQGKMLNKQIIYSLKHYDPNKNSINVLTLNNTISNTPNNNFIGKKILLSKHPLLIKNKFSNNNKKNKNIEINSSLFGDKFNDNENGIYSFDRSFNNKILYKTRNHFSTKIEKDLNEILNRKNNYDENEESNMRRTYINKNQSFEPLINFKNRQTIEYVNTQGESFLKPNKMKLIKNNNNRNGITLINKNNYSNKYLKPDMMRKVLYIDQYNNTLSSDKTLNLINEEKKYINDNIHKFLFKYYFDEKGNKIYLPLLTQENSKNYNFNSNSKFSYDSNGKFLTEFDKRKNGKLNNDENSKEAEGKLGKLIYDRFTMNNYRNVTPSKMKGNITNFNLKNNYEFDFNFDEEITPSRNFHKTLQNFNINVSKKKRNKEKTKNNVLNDILGIINSKVITTPIKKVNSIKKNKDNEEDDNEKQNKFSRKYVRALSRMENVINDFNLTNKLFGEGHNNLMSLFLIKDTKGNNIKIRFKDKGNNLLAPINEEGEEIKDMRILKNINEHTKLQFNKDVEEKMLQKSFSYDYISNFVNPIADVMNKDNSDENNKKKEKNENKILKKKIDEEKLKKEKEKEKRNNRLLINKLEKLEKSEKKKQNHFKILSKAIKIKERKISTNKNINSPMKKSNISQIKNNNKDILDTKVEPEITDPEIKSLLNDIKNIKQDLSTFYHEEDDFIQDFNFDFYSSSDESESANIKKKMRHIRKKKNKYLFSIFNYIAKNTDFKKEFTKGDLIKYLINEDFKYNFQQLKEQITLGRQITYGTLDPGFLSGEKKIFIKDLEIINYLFRYIEDKDSIFYRAVYNPKKHKNKKGKQADNDNEKQNQMLTSKKGRKKKRLSVYNRGITKEYMEDKNKLSKKKNEKKRKSSVAENEVITQSEKKLLILNEINLTNEIKYQISISNDKESREKFKNLLNKIESLRNLDSNEYVKMLKKNYDMFKDEINEIIKAKEIEERLNGFVDNLNYQRNNLKDKHKYIMSLLFVKDNKFLSTFEKNLNEANYK